MPFGPKRYPASQPEGTGKRIVFGCERIGLIAHFGVVDGVGMSTSPILSAAMIAGDDRDFVKLGTIFGDSSFAWFRITVGPQSSRGGSSGGHSTVRGLSGSMTSMWLGVLLFRSAEGGVVVGVAEVKILGPGVGVVSSLLAKVTSGGTGGQIVFVNEVTAALVDLHTIAVVIVGWCGMLFEIGSAGG